MAGDRVWKIWVSSKCDRLKPRQSQHPATILTREFVHDDLVSADRGPIEAMTFRLAAVKTALPVPRSAIPNISAKLTELLSSQINKPRDQESAGASRARTAQIALPFKPAVLAASDAYFYGGGDRRCHRIFRRAVPFLYFHKVGRFSVHKSSIASDSLTSHKFLSFAHCFPET